MTTSTTFAAVALALVLAPTAALAHSETDAGATTQLVIGWAVEPALAGFPNAVEVVATHDGELRNDADLSVTILFGDEDSATASDPLTLEKVFGQAGTYHASIIPTDPGTYTFQISGTVGEDTIDVAVTSGSKTFDAVVAPADIQFPTKVPAVTDLSDRLDQLGAQGDEIIAATLAAEDAKDAASNSRLVAMIALAVGALSALFGFAALRRSTT